MQKLPSLVCMLDELGVWRLKSARILEVWHPDPRVWSPQCAAVASLALLYPGLQKQAVQKDTCGINPVGNPGCCPYYAKH